MAMPKKRMTQTRSGKRRGQINLARPTTAVCAHCQSVIQPHTVCKSCGYYRGQKVNA